MTTVLDVTVRGIASQVPTVGSQVVPRPRLLRQLNEARLSGRLTAVCAPAGCGKTSLLAHWAVTLPRKRPSVRVAWLTVDTETDDPYAFWIAVVDALRRAGVALTDRPLWALRSLPPARCGVVAEMVGAEISAVAAPLVLVVDRHERLDDRDVRDSLVTLAGALPSSAHIVVAHDTSPHDRTADIFAGVGANLVDPRVARGAAAEPTAIADVLDRLPPRHRSFLVQTSIVDLVSAPLADAIRESRDSERILERLTDGDLPVSRESPPDGGLVWYRYHPLLRDALLSRVGRDRRRLWTLRDRAVRWYTDAGSTVSAVRCAVALADRARAARILADSLDSLLAARSGRAVRLLCQHVGADETARYPRLAMMVAMSLIADGLSDEADAWLSHVDAALDGIESRGLSGGLTTGGRDPVDARYAEMPGWHSPRAAVAAARAANVGAGQDLDVRVAAGRAAVAIETDPGRPSTLSAQIALGCAQLRTGQSDEGMATLAAVLGSVADTGVMPVPALVAAGVLAAEQVRRGRAVEARFLVDGARGVVSQLVDQLGPGAGPAVTDLILADAALARDRGDFLTTHEALDRAEGLAQATGREDEIALLRRRMALAEQCAQAVPESISLSEARAKVDLLRIALSLTDLDRGLLTRLRGRETQKSIERELDLKPGELRGRVTRLYAKLGVTTRPDAVRRGKQLQVW